MSTPKQGTHAHLEHIWDTSGTHLEHIWNTSGTHLEHVWSTRYRRGMLVCRSSREINPAAMPAHVEDTAGHHITSTITKRRTCQNYRSPNVHHKRCYSHPTIKHSPFRTIRLQPMGSLVGLRWYSDAVGRHHRDRAYRYSHTPREPKKKKTKIRLTTTFPASTFWNSSWDFSAPDTSPSSVCPSGVSPLLFI